jgi:hypothetical protein
MRSRRPSKRIRTLALLLLGLSMGAGPPLGQDASGDAAKSAKERLSDKGSDEQRVNNCRVPLERRGSQPRPDCPTAQAAEKSGTEQQPER